jgi:hypothetical protein
MGEKLPKAHASCAIESKSYATFGSNELTGVWKVGWNAWPPERKSNATCGRNDKSIKYLHTLLVEVMWTYLLNLASKWQVFAKSLMNVSHFLSNLVHVGLPTEY